MVSVKANIKAAFKAAHKMRSKMQQNVQQVSMPCCSPRPKGNQDGISGMHGTVDATFGASLQKIEKAPTPENLEEAFPRILSPSAASCSSTASPSDASRRSSYSAFGPSESLTHHVIDDRNESEYLATPRGETRFLLASTLTPLTEDSHMKHLQFEESTQAEKQSPQEASLRARTCQGQDDVDKSEEPEVIVKQADDAWQQKPVCCAGECHESEKEDALLETLEEKVKRIEGAVVQKQAYVEFLQTQERWEMFHRVKEDAKSGDCFAFVYCVLLRLRLSMPLVRPSHSA